MDQWEAEIFVRDWYHTELTNVEFYYADSIGGYSWAATLIVFRQNGQLYMNSNIEEWDPYPVTEKEALDSMIEFEEEMSREY